MYKIPKRGGGIKERVAFIHKLYNKKHLDGGLDKLSRCSPFPLPPAPELSFVGSVKDIYVIVDTDQLNLDDVLKDRTGKPIGVFFFFFGLLFLLLSPLL